MRRFALFLLLGLIACMSPQNNSQNTPESCTPAPCWAFEEQFDHDPASPSQALLPQNLDYAVTHRSHPGRHYRDYGPFPADHAEDCSGPDPTISPLAQHQVISRHESQGQAPDASFYICKKHLMSAMGDVEGYSVSSFWPKQAFDFSEGGVLEFEVNINDQHPRSWWEILITPREQLKIGAAQDWLPIDETYPRDRIVLSFDPESTRQIMVGTKALAPEGWQVNTKDWRRWRDIDPNDPALHDRRIRRSMRISLSNEAIHWDIEMQDGSVDRYSAALPQGLPFQRGLVLFKTHAYTPLKDGNTNTYTFHWDSIRFSGPVVDRYDTIFAEDVIYLQANGSRPIGDQQSVTITIDRPLHKPVLFGQLHSPLKGQVLLSINGRNPITIHPYDYDTHNCSSSGWKSFRLALDPAQLEQGKNTLTWIVGERPDCVEDWVWDGFSVKHLQLQVNADE